MPVIPVDDAGDPRLVELTQLTDAAARRRIEAEHGCFVAEGWLVLDAVLRSAYPLRSVLVAADKLDRAEALLGPVADHIPVYVASTTVLEAVTGFAIHRGVVASVGRLPLPDPLDVIGDGHVLVVEGVNDQENLGALFRNAAAFAAPVLLDPTTADPLYRRSVRVSLGHVVHVPWSRVDHWPGAIDQLKRAGRTVVALTPSGDVAIHELVPARPIAWLVGAEGPGLSGAAIDAADLSVRIPIAAGVDSLNVATAAAIALARTATTPPAGGPHP